MTAQGPAELIPGEAEPRLFPAISTPETRCLM